VLSLNFLVGNKIMATSKQNKKRVYWGEKYESLPQLDFLRIQKKSYDQFLTREIKRELEKVNPIEDFTAKNWRMEFLDHHFEEGDYSPLEALNKGLTYSKPLKVLTRLINKRSGEEIEEEVFFGDFPQMTVEGTFIINGVERAIVNQLIRSPGVFYSGEVDQVTGRTLYIADLRPLRGSWLKISVDRKDVINARIDRHRKIPVTMLLRAAGLESDEEIKEFFEEVDNDEEHAYIQETLEKDPTTNKDEALIGIYKKLRPGEPAILDNARNYFNDLFFNSGRYDLGKVGRYKLNKRLNLDIPNKLENHVLTLSDLKASVKYLIQLQKGDGRVDDIDHLSNRRVRRVGELVLDTAFRVGLYRLERSIKEKMSLAKTSSLVTPGSLINPRPMVAVVNNFFRRNRLSAILDQTNPLSEIDNLRRLSPLGKGGVTRERASFSMRDINPSQYSRIDPIRSPEGPNIGLVTYLSLYAKVNEYGFLEAPYRKIEKVKKNGKVKMKVTDEIVYLPADEEEEYHITHAEVEKDRYNYITEDWVPVRHQGEFKEASVEKVEYMDVVSRQVVGTSASLIPFLAHDEANRALMGSHMQCQAVPLLNPESPIVGTGMEEEVATAMQRTISTGYGGKVKWVDANKIVIEVNKTEQKQLGEDKKDFPESIKASQNNKEVTYYIEKFRETSQSTSYSQKPLVEMSDRVKKGDLIIDGPACDYGELALGRNLLIAYCSLEGLEYEDAVVISDRVVKEDLLTSIYINNYEAEVMDTKLGPEELTRDIPHVSEKELANLTEEGIIAVGSGVGPNDILVGKIAPKGEKELTAEERLLRAIFGEKARDVKDTSLRMPHGERGTVVDVQVLSKKKGD
jgi:DNA-directed RNA polymerase subunit beta